MVGEGAINQRTRRHRFLKEENDLASCHGAGDTFLEEKDPRLKSKILYSGFDTGVSRPVANAITLAATAWA
ncbi:hypothetical protein AVEN_125952-1 [Araneus ventricosus]|uniref:Uncharacterized protein n=1 Tax=Araneus ventricosus TaxID=182803 RepID=A0A4Y2WF47_ARAVE|nr:hypothetical protein AVEN_125952-1 [Araneus ventricosus]